MSTLVRPTFSLPRGLAEQMTKMAAEQDMNISEFLRYLIRKESVERATR